ncbi:hypothetical protein [Jannaschia formosa]|uniref:hypothetical protein n=1 Tax=Jannaschia formosa TaxID=2259592 RepID=UPI000E1B810F|nr:hypothetical protein [Jannaschia formosa]TFL18447.1 hypothetical protein DR046_10165 [Jannaschia formosa]
MLKPKPKAPVPERASPREAARALLSMLGEGGPAGGRVPEEQMRLLARDLIAQVEGRAPARMPPATPSVPQPMPERRRKLFSRSAPLVAEAEAPATPPPPAGPSMPPDDLRVATDRAGWIPPERSQSPETSAVRSRGAQMRAEQAPAPSDLPTSFAIPDRRTRRTAPPAILPLGQVRKLALQGIELGETEHPAILALTLRGRPPLDQAVALRALPRGQARAVHRMLRMMEARG